MTHEEYEDEVIERWEQGEVNELEEEGLIIKEPFDHKNNRQEYRLMNPSEFESFQQK